MSPKPPYSLDAAQRRKLREYAAQDRKDADWFEYMGDSERAAEYRVRAACWEKEANCA